MITPDDERIQGSGDVVSVHLWDPKGARFVAVREARSADSSAATGVLVTNGEAEQAGSVSLTTEAPLERWHMSLEAPDGPIECDLHAVTAPVDLSATAGGHRYVQLCEVTGTITGLAVRAHSWGDPDGSERRRFVSVAVPGGPFLSVAAARAEASVPHGDELVSGHIVDPDAAGEPRPLEEVRLSTVYDPAGLPRKAGLELYRPGEELPERVAGEAVWSAPGLSFFRWHIAGSPAWGTYEVEQSA